MRSARSVTMVGPVIDLPEEERRAVLARLLEPGTVEPYSTHVLPPGHEARAVAARLERRVLGLGGLRTPDEADLLVCVVDVVSMGMAGVLRVGRPSASWGSEPMLAALHAVAPDLDLDRGVWELASVVVHPAHRPARGGAVALALYQGLAGLLERGGVRWLVARLDVAVLRVLTWHLAGMFEALPVVARRAGGPEVLPVWCDVRAWRGRLTRSEPQMAELLFEERGLDGIVRPVAWSAVEPLLPFGGSPRPPG